MARKLSPKSTYYARRSPLALAVFALVIGVALGACIYDERLLSPLVPFGLAAAALLVSEFERRGIITPFARRKVCEMGADGLLVSGRFFPCDDGDDVLVDDRFYAWSDVVSAECEDSHAGREGIALFMRRVVLKMRDGSKVYLEPFNSQAFVREFLVRSKTPKRMAEAPEPEAYRHASAPTKAQLVRVATDASMSVEERARALERLDGEERERLEEALVDDRLQRKE